MYWIESGNEIKSFSVQQYNIPVSSLENKGNDYILVGYNDGNMNIFDEKKLI